MFAKFLAVLCIIFRLSVSPMAPDAGIPNTYNRSPLGGADRFEPGDTGDSCHAKVEYDLDTEQFKVGIECIDNTVCYFNTRRYQCMWIDATVEAYKKSHPVLSKKIHIFPCETAYHNQNDSLTLSCYEVPTCWIQKPFSKCIKEGLCNINGDKSAVCGLRKYNFEFEQCVPYRSPRSPDSTGRSGAPGSPYNTPPIDPAGPAPAFIVYPSPMGPDGGVPAQASSGLQHRPQGTAAPDLDEMQKQIADLSKRVELAEKNIATLFARGK